MAAKHVQGFQYSIIYFGKIFCLKCVDNFFYGKKTFYFKATDARMFGQADVMLL